MFALWLVETMKFVHCAPALLPPFRAQTAKAVYQPTTRSRKP